MEFKKILQLQFRNQFAKFGKPDYAVPAWERQIQVSAVKDRAVFEFSIVSDSAGLCHAPHYFGKNVP